jgi:hypothetical protein
MAEIKWSPRSGLLLWSTHRIKKDGTTDISIKKGFVDWNGSGTCCYARNI